MDEDFGIGVGAEVVAAGFEAGAEFEVVVDFAVEDDLEVAVLVGDGLPAAFEVDDGEAEVAEGGGAFLEVAVAVGAAVEDAVAHGADQSGVGGAMAIGHKSGDSAHKRGSFILARAAGPEAGGMVARGGRQGLRC